MAEFIKRHETDVSADWDRVLRLFRAAQSSPEFSSPRPLRILPDSTSIAYEMLPPGKRLGQFLAASLGKEVSRANAVSDALRHTGIALAALHDRMPAAGDSVAGLPRIEGHAPPSVIARARNEIAAARVRTWHGDYGHGNVWLADDGELWIYDPIPAAFYSDRTATRAPIHFDIAHMVATLYAVYPMRLQPRLDPTIQSYWAETFITAYEDASSASIDRTTIFLLAADNLRRYAIHIRHTRPLFKAIVWLVVLSCHRRRLLRNIGRVADLERLS